MIAQLLAGKTMLVTGAARGLGAAIAETAIRHGATVLLTDVLADEVRVTAAGLGPNASALTHDVADPGSWATVGAELLRLGVGRPDVLVNNAGIIRGAALADATHADLMRTLEVNAGGTFLGISMYASLHRSTVGSGQRPGSIVNISSVRGLIGGARSIAYSASKFAIRGLTKSAAVELGPLGIRVNAVCPGPIESEMSVGNPQFADLDWDAYVANLPLGALGRPVDIGEAVAWLGSDASAFVTGIDLAVDGGLTATSYSVTGKAKAAPTG